MDAAELLREHTIQDIYSLPDGRRAELIDGRLYMMAAPDMVHQRISAYLHNEIYNFIRKKNGRCEAFAAPFAVFLDADDRTYLEPDISVICDEKQLTGRGCFGAPDWIIEIVSPSSRMMDYYKKLFLYRRAGVLEYWIADWDKNRLTVYDFRHETVKEYAFSDAVTSSVLEGLVIDFSWIKP